MIPNILYNGNKNKDNMNDNTEALKQIFEFIFFLYLTHLNIFSFLLLSESEFYLTLTSSKKGLKTSAYVSSSSFEYFSNVQKD